MMNKILNHQQIKILQSFAGNKFIRQNFYWTGGTALSELYLKHRLSEDLDFFSDDLYPKELLLAEMNKLKKIFPIIKIKYVENKNRQQFTLRLANKIIKLEFVYFPFDKINGKKINLKYGIKVDSIKSIGENKIFALYETADPKHAFDLYWIVKKNRKLLLKQLYSSAIKKFGVEIDKIILLEKALEAIDKMNKIKPMVLAGFKVPPERLIKFFSTLK